MDDNVIRLDIPVDIMGAVLNDPATIIFKLLPEKNSIEKLKENIRTSESKSFALMAYCNITLDDVEAYEKGTTDCVGSIVANKKIEDYSDDYIANAFRAMDEE